MDASGHQWAGKGFLEEVAFEQDTWDSELSNLRLSGDRVPLPPESCTHITSDAPIVFISVCQTKALGSVGAYVLPAGQPSSKGRELALSRAVVLSVLPLC